MLRFLKRLAADVPTPAADKVTLFVDTAGVAKLKDETGAVTDVGGALSGSTGVALLGYATKSADQAMTISTVTDITGLSVTATVAASRLLRVQAKVRITNTSATAATYQLLLFEGATQLDYSEVVRATTVSGHTFVASWLIVAPTAASHTYKLAFYYDVGGVTVRSGAGNLATMTLEDLGPS